MEKLHRIAEYTLNNIKSAIDASMIVHDVRCLSRKCRAYLYITAP